MPAGEYVCPSCQRVVNPLGHLCSGRGVMDNLERLEILTHAKEEIVSLRARVKELEQALAVIGERAVVDFDDATVGDVDRLVKTNYADWLKAVLGSAAKNAEIREAYGRLSVAVQDFLSWTGPDGCLTSSDLYMWREKFFRILGGDE